MQLYLLALLLAACAALDPLPPNAGFADGIIPDQTKGYGIGDLGNGVFAITDGVYWSMVVVSVRNQASDTGRENGAGHSDRNDNGRRRPRTLCVVDAPVGFMTSTQFLAAINEIKNRVNATGVSDMIYSHQHKDHIGFARLVKEAFPGLRIHSSAKVARRLAERNDTDRPLPTRTYAGNFTLPEFGLQGYDIGEAHTPGNVMLLHPASRVMFYIDIIFPGWTPFRDLAQAEYSPAFYEAHAKVLSFDFQYLIAGHLSRLGKREDVVLQKQYFEAIIANAQHALATVSPGPLAFQLGVFDPTSPNFRNYWALFDAYLAALDNVCTERTLVDWRGRLGAVDVFTKSHCSKIVESLRID